MSLTHTAGIGHGPQHQVGLHGRSDHLGKRTDHQVLGVMG